MRHTLELIAAIALVAAVGCSNARDAQDQPLAGPPSASPSADPAASVVLVETAAGQGSGVIFDDRHVLTDAHVVWPFHEVAVQLPDGTPVTATVLAFDRSVDLAVLELPSTLAGQLSPIPLAATIELGQTVTHHGYSRGATGAGASPASGARSGTLIARETIGDFNVTLLETNAAAIPGFSGGALVNGAGELIGITQFLLVPDRIFALSAADAIQRARRLIEQASTEDTLLGQRIEGSAVTASTFTLSGPHAHAAFLATADEAFELRLDARSDSPITLAVLGLHGHIVDDAISSGRGELTITTQVPANSARLAVVQLVGDGPALVHLEAGAPLHRLLDEDHGQPIVPDQLTFAALDYPSDVDLFELELPAYGTVLARATSLTFDPILQVELLTPEGPILIALNDDGGSGLFGTNSLLQFTAPVDGTYRFIVSDAGGTIGHAGGYALLVSSPFIDPQ